MSVKHTFVSAKPPSVDPDKVGSSEWNEEHVVNITPSDVGSPALVSPSVVDNIVTFADIAGGQKDSGYSISDFQFPVLRYIFNTATGNSDPGAGKVKSLDAGGPLSTEFLVFSATDADGRDLSSFWSILKSGKQAASIVLAWDGGSVGWITFDVLDPSPLDPTYNLVDVTPHLFGESYPADGTPVSVTISYKATWATGDDIDSGTDVYKAVHSKAIMDSNLGPILTAQAANKVLAGPVSGGAAVMAPRALVAADIPALSYLTGVTSDAPLSGAGTAASHLVLGVVPASLGGTGVANGASASLTLPNVALTLAAAGAYTLTIPATGTAALLATANVFTAAQTLDVASGLDSFVVKTSTVGGNVKIKMQLSGNTSAPAFEWQIYGASGVEKLRLNATGPVTLTNLISIASATGYFGIGTTGSTAKFHVLSPASNVVTAIFQSAASPSVNNVEFHNSANVAKGFVTPTFGVTLYPQTTVTNAIVEGIKINAEVSTASTGGAAGFGVGLGLWAETATDGTSKQQGRLWGKWIVPTNGSETSAVGLDAYINSTAQEFISGEANAAGAKLSLYGGARVARAAALTTQLTTITYTAPGTPDFAIQDVTQITPWGFADAEELRTFISVVKNLQDRVAEIDSRLNATTGINVWA